MGDISEYRGIIVAVSFVTVAVVLITLMVSESPLLFTGVSAGQSGVTEDSAVANPIALLAWTNQTNQTLSSTSDHTDFPISAAGWNLLLQVWTPGWAGPGKGYAFYMYSYDSWWILKWNYQEFNWFKDEVDVTYIGTGNYPYLLLSQLDADYAAGGTSSLLYEARNSLTRIHLNFGFNTTEYATPTAALVGGELYLMINVDFSDRNTSINVIALLAGIFTFSLPGFDPTISFLIMIPIYAAFGYIVFIVALRIVGAVFGGGGA